MDTDVEVIKPLDEFLKHTAFSGFENEKDVPTGIMASEKGGKWAKENLDYYNNRHFINANGNFEIITNVRIITNYMLQYKLKRNNTYQDFPGLITMYPNDYFCPKSHTDGKIRLTANSVTIHHFAGSWLSEKILCFKRIQQKLSFLPNFISFTIAAVYSSVKYNGLFGACKNGIKLVLRK